MDIYNKAESQRMLDYNLTLPSVEYVSNNDNVIWSYWGYTTDYSFMTKVAIHSWKKSNPTLKICMLSPAVIYQYFEATELPENFDKLSVAHKEDAIKLAVLDKYGGIWVGSNVILAKSSVINDWMENRNYSVGGYYIPIQTTNKDLPIVDTSFMVAPKEGPIVRDWKQQVYLLLKGKVLDNMKALSLDLQKMPLEEDHLLQLAFLKVMTTPPTNPTGGNTVIAPPVPPIKFISADGGPYKYRKESPIYLLTKPIAPPIEPILILTKDDKRSVENSWFLKRKDSYLDRIVRNDT